MSDVELTIGYEEDEAEKEAAAALIKRAIYASFKLGTLELAVDVRHLREVVPYPHVIAAMPLAPTYLVGIFNLRGAIVPVIDLRSILRLEAHVSPPTQRVAIVDYDVAQVGFVFDETGEIIRLSDHHVAPFRYAEGQEAPVIQGAIRLANGDRILQILDPKALVSLRGVPSPQNAAGRSRRTVELVRRDRRTCISFVVGTARLGFEITGIREIVSVPQIHHSPIDSALCIGTINLRGQIIPIINMHRLLRAESVEGGDAEQRRIIVLEQGRERFGLLVDAVESIDAYGQDDIMPIPLLNEERSTLFLGCVTLKEGGDVILLDHRVILTNREAALLTQGHSALYQTQNDEHREAKAAAGKRQSYISFLLQHRFGIPITEAKEIVAYPDKIMPTPGMPQFIRGVLNLRGQAITIIDTLAFYRGDGVATPVTATSKVMIIEKNEELFGLVVDSVEDILHVDEREKLKLPEMLLNGLAGGFRRDVKEMMEVTGSGGQKVSLVVLNIELLLERIRSVRSRFSTPPR